MRELDLQSKFRLLHEMQGCMFLGAGWAVARSHKCDSG